MQINNLSSPFNNNYPINSVEDNTPNNVIDHVSPNKLPPLYILQKPKKIESSKFTSIIITIGKVIISPILIPFYLIKKPFVIIASICGLGTHKEIKQIDLVSREALLQMGGEDVRFKKEHGHTLEGIYFTTDKVSDFTKTILLCTGSHLSYEHYAVPMVRELLSMGHNVMVFNYEGFGNSEGTPSEKSIYRSAENVYQFLSNKGS